MTHDDTTDPVQISRRTLLGIALGTMPAAALAGGPLAALWPGSERRRARDEPYLLRMSSGGDVFDSSLEMYKFTLASARSTR